MRNFFAKLNIFGFINIRHIHNDKKSDQNYFFKQLWTENYGFVSPNYVNLCMAYLALVVNVIFLDALASLKTMLDIHSVADVFKISRLQSIREYYRV